MTNDHASLHVSVLSPREPDPRAFVFTRTETVGDAARAASTAFGYTGGNPSFQNADGEVLDRTKSLVAAHLHDGATVELVDVGGGV
jgi:hypothetical protein